MKSSISLTWFRYFLVLAIMLFFMNRGLAAEEGLPKDEEICLEKGGNITEYSQRPKEVLQTLLDQKLFSKSVFEQNEKIDELSEIENPTQEQSDELDVLNSRSAGEAVAAGRERAAALIAGQKLIKEMREKGLSLSKDKVRLACFSAIGRNQKQLESLKNLIQKNKR